MDFSHVAWRGPHVSGFFEPMGRDVRLSRAFRRSRRFKNVAVALGVRVRELRKGAGWTLEKASARMGLDFRHLQQIEAGTVNVTLATILRMCDAFDCSPSILLPSAREPKLKLGPVHVRTFGAIRGVDPPGMKRRSELRENPIEPPPPAETTAVKKRVGAMIKSLRLEKGWTQKKMAALLTVTETYVQDVERGKGNLTIESLVKFSKVFGVDPGRLVALPIVRVLDQ